MRILTLILAFFIANNSFACECIQQPLIYRIQNSAFIAKVKVLTVSEPSSYSEYQDAQIEIIELFKGKKISTIKIHSNLMSSCNLTVIANTEWLLFAQVDMGGLLSFGSCSGSVQLDRKLNTNEYPNAESIARKINDRKLKALRFLSSNHIEYPNEYNLQLTGKRNVYEKFKGFEDVPESFAVYQLTIKKNLVISKIKALKPFFNSVLSDSLLNYLKENATVNTRNISGIEKRTKLVLVYYYYPSGKQYPSFISDTDL